MENKVFVEEIQMYLTETEFKYYSKIKRKKDVVYTAEDYELNIQVNEEDND